MRVYVIKAGPISVLFLCGEGIYKVAERESLMVLETTALPGPELPMVTFGSRCKDMKPQSSADTRGARERAPILNESTPRSV